jgi:DNA-binding transcriptional regulator YiaG|tara:strand:- start:649 stop:840 length:192 start_codon:yes stop_codon:yes gene_type:complete
MDKTLAQQIKDLRTSLGVSQDKFAEQLNVGVASVRRWESGSTIPLPNHQEKIKQLNKENNESR